MLKKIATVLALFFMAATQTTTMYYLDIREPGESLFGGKRIFHLYSKTPQKYTSLSLVEYKARDSVRIEPLLSHEYYIFFLAAGFVLYIPKCEEAIIRTLEYDEEGDVVQDFSKELVNAQFDFPRQLHIIQQMLRLNDRKYQVELWFHNPDDFCDRLQKIYPHGDGDRWPCCDAKFESTFSPLPPVVDDVYPEPITTGKEQVHDGFATPVPTE